MTQPAAQVVSLPSVVPVQSHLIAQLPTPIEPAPASVSDNEDTGSQASSTTPATGGQGHDTATMMPTGTLANTSVGQATATTIGATAGVADAPVDAAPVAAAPIASPVVDTPVVAGPIASPVVDTPVAAAPIASPVVDTPVVAAPIVSPVVDIPIVAAPIVASPIDVAPAAAKDGTSAEVPAPESSYAGAAAKMTAAMPMPSVPPSLNAAGKSTDPGTASQSVHQPEAVPQSPFASKLNVKPELPNEALSAQAHRLNENPLNLGKMKAAAKSELDEALTSTSSKSEMPTPASSSPAPSTPEPNSLQTPSSQNSAQVNEQPPDGVQKAEASLHKNEDDAGTKSQSDNGSSQGSASGVVPDSAFSVGSSAATSQASSASVPAVSGLMVNEVRNASADPDISAKTPVRSAEATQAASESGETHASSGSGTYPASMFSSAKLIEHMGESELRLGIRSGEFGSVDIRTSMGRNQVTAEISVERGELGRVLAAELPSLQNRLSEQRIPVANIVVQNQGGGNSGTSEQQKPRQEPATLSESFTNPQQEASVAPAVAAMAVAGNSGSRLDIHM